MCCMVNQRIRLLSFSLSCLWRRPRPYSLPFKSACESHLTQLIKSLLSLSARDLKITLSGTDKPYSTLDPPHLHLPMDSEKKKIQPELARTRQLFLDFMTRITKFDESIVAGSRLLVGFHHELELLRKPPLQKTSEVAECIIKANYTDRMKMYVEAGCRHVHVAVQNTINAKVLLDELKCLVEDAIVVMDDVTANSSQVLDELPVDGLVQCAPCFEKDEKDSECLQCLQVSDYALMMGILFSMVKLDCDMQEKIVKSLDYNSSSEHLESYCLMWDLRPYVNDNIMQQAWRHVP